jgi:hypothetical protein
MTDKRTAVDLLQGSMTTAEMLRAEGEARVEARWRESLLEQLSEKFGPLPEGATEAIQSADPPQPRRWFSRVLSASTLADVMDS